MQVAGHVKVSWCCHLVIDCATLSHISILTWVSLKSTDVSLDGRMGHILIHLLAILRSSMSVPMCILRTCVVNHVIVVRNIKHGQIFYVSWCYVRNRGWKYVLGLRLHNEDLHYLHWSYNGPFRWSEQGYVIRHASHYGTQEGWRKETWRKETTCKT